MVSSFGPDQRMLRPAAESPATQNGSEMATRGIGGTSVLFAGKREPRICSKCTKRSEDREGRDEQNAEFQEALLSGRGWLGHFDSKSILLTERRAAQICATLFRQMTGSYALPMTLATVSPIAAGLSTTWIPA